MIERDSHWSLSNPGPNKLLIWLEPWGEEFEVPARSTVAVAVTNESEKGAVDEVEWTPDHLILWAGAGTMKIFIDGVLQESASAVVPIPDSMTKQMLGIVFANQPAARLGGQPIDPTERTSHWRRIMRRLGL